MRNINNIARVVTALRSVTGDGFKPLHEPRFAGNEWVYLKKCLDSSFVSSVGTYVDRFEADLATYTGAKHAIAVVNGTAALHIVLKLAGVVANDEVLIPALTFVATANTVSYCSAFPHFVDSEEQTLGIDATALREYLQRITEQRSGHCINKDTGRIIRALVPMHTFGHPSDIDGLLAVARDFNLALIEDAAESLGSFYQGKHTGTFGLMGTLSFNGNKTITTGGGGVILTDDEMLAKAAKHLTTTAKLPHRWAFEHDQVGFNYRMPNINAALGCAQLEQLPDFLVAKRCLFEKYQSVFSSVEGVAVVTEPPHSRSNYWLQALILDEADEAQREAVLEATNDAGIMTRPVWSLLNKLKPYRDCPAMDMPVAEGLQRRLINIPSSPQLVM